ncbi:MAG: DNA mismatch repair protein MutS [Planctomycetota bacterium]|jgi:DNA mismatch repair protein MutS
MAAAKKTAGGNSSTPAMAQYQAAKQKHPEALLLFRMGDFYELFFEDAKEASKVLGIALTSRSKGADPIPMAGVPVRAFDTYLSRLVKAGYKVAICEQMQDPKEAKGVVDREVVRVVTPGTLTEDNLLDDRRSNHLAALRIAGGQAGLAWVELSTGRFQVCECGEDAVEDELARIQAAEILIAENPESSSTDLSSVCANVTARPAYEFSVDSAERALAAFFSTANLTGFGIENMPHAIAAAGALLSYLEETQLTALPHISKIEAYHREEFMLLDRATRNSLELVDTMRGDGQGTPLLSIIDDTRTPMGSRLMHEWLLSPLTKVDAIAQRQSAVAELNETSGMITAAQEELRGILDLQRLTTRISCARANPRDLVALKQSLQRLPALLLTLAESVSDELRRISKEMDPLPEVAQRIQDCLIDEAPLTLREGGLVRSSFHPELDELRSLASDSKQWMAEFQAREAERLGIPNLKVGYNKVFGYYIEVTHGNRDAEIPESYVRKQTTKNAERYITEELKSFETRVLKSEDRAKDLEYELFCELREWVAERTERLQRTAELVAELDVLVGLASTARSRSYCRPEVDESLALCIKDGRHPVLEATHAAGSFVPNDSDLSAPDRQLVLLTGPNMAGKSTYIRQNALIVLLAQIGSFVPAESARIGLVDRVFTRVGGADDISRGASTFMVEMSETANILNNATERSLVILDEVGRGTSTYDGLALAWAIVEDLHERIGCRGFFATHYHQLTSLSESCRGVINSRVAVREWGDEVVFLHRIEVGGTDRSYGLHVGRLAGIPSSVLSRAKEILSKLEDETEATASIVGSGEQAEEAPTQLELFQPPREKVLKMLSGLDIERLTPIEALQKLAELVKTLGEPPAR